VRFHIGIAEAAHSPRLIAAITAVHGELKDVMVAMDHPAEGLIRSNEQHRELSDLLRRGDSIHAVFLMRKHVEQPSRCLAPRTKGAG
jgi:DNA-binding FadR family transcriptional regulator